MIQDAVSLLCSMIATPSPSRDEAAVADMICDRLSAWGMTPRRYRNNIAVTDDRFTPGLPVLMLNSHIDTVKPASSYTIDPYTPLLRDGRIYGLGSNDAGASVVSLIEVFDRLRGSDLPYNLLLALSAEEEVGGENGMRHLLPALEADGINIDMALVGEPTGMQPAVAERGLIVLDCVTRGITGHAARNEGVNAIYEAMSDIDRMRHCQFAKQSEILGPVKVTVTQIEAGRQHNVIPDECKWVADVRTTDAYTNEQTAAILQAAVSGATTATPRSTRVRASVISADHPLVKAAVALGRTPFVSPTTSDMSLMWHFPSLKMGPGLSSRSHSADEYVLESEISEAVTLYESLLTNIKL